MHIITLDNAEEARVAAHDIIGMCIELETYSGFSYGIDTGYFDPFVYINSRIFVNLNTALPVDIELLHESSAIALLCHFYDIWCETKDINTTYLERIRDTENTGLLSEFKDIEEVIQGAFKRDLVRDNLWLREALQPIYDKRVLSFRFRQGLD